MNYTNTGQKVEPTTTEKTLEVALEYAKRGLSIIPIKKNAKKPTLRSWECFQQNAAPERKIRDWFTAGGKGIGIILGAVSGGLIVRDFDEMDEYEKWKQKKPELAELLPTVVTSQGMHVYCRSDSVKTQYLDGGELRADGAYVVAPPSIHRTGHLYKWVVPFGDEIPFLALDETGFLDGKDDTERTERTERTGRTERTDDHRGRQRKTEDIKGGGCEIKKQFEVSPEIEELIQKTSPKKNAVRNKAVFQFARELKSLPGMAESDSGQWMNVLRRWHTLALPYISTKPFEETRIDFLQAWPKVRHLVGEDPVSVALKRAKKSTDSWGYEDPTFNLLATVCKELQRVAGSEPFFLSCRKAGELLGVPYVTANRWLFLLENDKIIKTIEKGTQKKATRFRFLSPIAD